MTAGVVSCMFLCWGVIFAGLVILTSPSYSSELLVPGGGVGLPPGFCYVFVCVGFAHKDRYIKLEAHTTKSTHVYISHTCSLSHRKTNAPNLRTRTHSKTLEAEEPPAGNKKFRRIRRRCQNNQSRKNHPLT